MTDTTVQTNPDAALPSGVYGWDWSETTHAGREGLVMDLARGMGADRLVPGKGLQGWSKSVECFDGDGFKVGQVWWGASRDDVHVRSTSAAADGARSAVLGVDAGKTSRVDTRVDTLAAWEDLVEVCQEAASIYGTRLTDYESYTIDRHGERQSQGRTLYLGAPTSAVRVRLYEKWRESPGQYVDGTNRVEVQLRPPSKVKDRVSGWDRASTFCASKTTRHLAELLGSELAPKASLHVSKGTPDLERTLQVMGDQYGPAVAEWLAVSGGDFDTVADRLLSRVPDARLWLTRGEFETA